MDTDDCIVVATSGKSPVVLASSKTSPTTPVSAKKLVQARLPFKPLHAVQCATDAVAPKKRKLIDSNANFQRAKNLKKEAEKLVEIISNNDTVIEVTAPVPKEKSLNTVVRDSACEPDRRVGSPVWDENVFTPVKNAKTIQDNNSVIDLTDSCGEFEVVTVNNDDESSCVTSKNSDLISDSGSDVMDTSTADSEPGHGTELSKGVKCVEFHISPETVPCLQPVNLSESGNETVTCMQLVSSSEPGNKSVTCMQPVSLSEPGNESVAHIQPVGSIEPDEEPAKGLQLMSTSQPIVAEQAECVPATGEDLDYQGQQHQSSNSNSSENEVVGETTKAGQVTTPVNKNKEFRKSLDKKTKEERALDKERREKEKEEAKLKKIQDRQEKEKEKEKEKAEKEKEKAEKEKEKAERKKQKEDERLRKQEQLLEEKKKKEEAKLEEKKKKEEKKEKPDEKVCVKEKQLMQKFFVKSTKDPAVQKTLSDVKTGPFMGFQIKENMRLSPIVRLDLELLQQAASDLDQVFSSEECVEKSQLYIGELRNGSHLGKTYPPTWPSHEARTVDDVIMLPPSEQTPGCFMRAKLFQFHDNYRPAYYGTWRKRSRVITPRNPLQLDKKLLDYEVDSDEEWEEEEPGESLSHSEPDDDDDEEAAEPDEDSDGFFVPHGYLSEGEGCEDDDEDDENNQSSPGKMKARQLLKARNWEAELRNKKKSEVLHPIVIGICWWSPDTVTSDPLYNKLREFQIQLFEVTPISTALKSKSTVKGNKNENKTQKRLSCKNITWLPVPEIALGDLVRLVHGNEWSIKKLIREFCEFWRCKTQPPDGTAVPDGEKQCLLSKRQLEAKIRQIAVYESRPEYPRRKLWYINADTLDRLELSSLPVPTQWKWLTKTFVVPPTVACVVSVPSTC